uniref:Uncharacterized protein n=1 Tax=Knipowitschia caucasica TaxID=637954 RepID=A0AAV2K8X4_KNICA
MYEKLAAMLEKGFCHKLKMAPRLLGDRRRDTRYPKMDGLNSMPCAGLQGCGHSSPPNVPRAVNHFSLRASGNTSQSCAVDGRTAQIDSPPPTMDSAVRSGPPE